MAGRKVALLVATYEYQDADLRQLVAPVTDAQDLADVLKNPEVADFDEVEILANRPLSEVGEAIGDFFNGRRSEDLTLLYFAGHGLKDDRGRLYLAMTNTKMTNLEFTGLDGSLVSRVLENSLAQQKVLILDCCYSGAFAVNATARAGTDVHTFETFGGRGRVVLTASDATSYAFEGPARTGDAERSLFTRILAEGLRTGNADIDQDGDITLDELYRYVHDRVVDIMPQQHPKFQQDIERSIVLARNVNWTLPERIRFPLDSLIADQRFQAIDPLRDLYRGGNRIVQLAVVERFRRLANDDSRRVSEAAQAFLAEHGAGKSSGGQATPTSGPETGSSHGSGGAPGSGSGLHASPEAATASSYEEAAAFEAAGDWSAAITAYATVLADPQHGAEAVQHLGRCRTRLRIGALIEQMRGFAAEGDDAAVLGIDDEICRLDPAGADPEGMATSARALPALPDTQGRPGPGAQDLDLAMAATMATRGQNLLQTRQFEKAISDFDTALDLAPTMSWALAERGTAYRSLGRYDEALADLNRATTLNPHLASAFADRGETFRLMERNDEALVDLTHAIELYPGHAWAIATRAQVYSATQRYDEAIADFTAAIELDPSMGWAIGERGAAYRLASRFYEALADFNRAIDLTRDYQFAFASRGVTYWQMSRHADALADFNRALAIDPGYAWA